MRPLDAVAVLADYREGDVKPMFVVAAAVMEDGHVVVATGSTLVLPPSIEDALVGVLAKAVNAKGVPMWTSRGGLS